MEQIPNTPMKLVRWMVAISFAIELAIAEGWLRIARGSSTLALLTQGQDLPMALAIGLGVAAVTAAASQYFFSHHLRQLTMEMFVPLFKGATPADALLLGVLPGIGEELLFRGTVQPEIGLVAASIVFGLLHSGLSRVLLPYGAWSAVVGAILGGIYLLTGNIWGSIVAHATINLSSTLWLRRLPPEP